MKKNLFAALAALAVGAVGCGGASAEDFAGLYRGSGSIIYTNSDGQKFTDSQNGWSESLSASVNSDKILFAGSCRVTATVTDDRTFAVDPNDCSLGQGRLSNGVTCDGRDRIKSGTGKLSDDGKKLVLSLRGEFVQEKCSDPSYNEIFAYTSEVSLAKQ